jgi:cystathionine gamma-synthase
VSVSIPDIAAVTGFESGDAATLRRIPRGYPRFRTHPYVSQVIDLISPEVTRPADAGIILTRSARAARAASAYAGLPVEAVFEYEGLNGVRLPAAGGLVARVRAYVQHTGGHLSSREAEDVLLNAGLIDHRQVETAVDDDAAETVTATLADAYGVRDMRDVSLHNSGMNAVAAAIAAISEIQQENGRRGWLQLGWIFFDTMSLLEKQVIDGDHVTIADPFDLAAVERAVTTRTAGFAGIIAEIPSNPSLQTPDIPALRTIADRAGCALVLDATIATPYNVDVLPYADVVCESLTKYAVGSADVLMGATVVNGFSRFVTELREGLRRQGDEPYCRDIARVAARIRGYRQRVKQVNANTLVLADWLERRTDAVRHVNWAYEKRSEGNYRKVERQPDSPGGLLMVDLKVPLEYVYDTLAVAKGPSFGADFTMASPQIFVAHFDLLSTPEGRGILAARGLHRDMLRISVGTEEPERIVETLEQARWSAAAR